VGIQPLAEIVAEWRAQHPARAAEPATLLAPRQAKPKKSEQFARHRYAALQPAGKMEWHYVPFLVPQPLAGPLPLPTGAEPRAELLEANVGGQKMMHFTNIWRAQALAQGHPLVASVCQRNLQNALELSLRDSVGRATRGHQPPWGLKVALAASGAATRVGVSVRGATAHPQSTAGLVGLDWSTTGANATPRDFAETQAVFEDIFMRNLCLLRQPSPELELPRRRLGLEKGHGVFSSASGERSSADAGPAAPQLDSCSSASSAAAPRFAAATTAGPARRELAGPASPLRRRQRSRIRRRKFCRLASPTLPQQALPTLPQQGSLLHRRQRLSLSPRKLSRAAMLLRRRQRRGPRRRRRQCHSSLWRAALRLKELRRRRANENLNRPLPQMSRPGPARETSASGEIDLTSCISAKQQEKLTDEQKEELRQVVRRISQQARVAAFGEGRSHWRGRAPKDSAEEAERRQRDREKLLADMATGCDPAPCPDEHASGIPGMKQKRCGQLEDAATAVASRKTHYMPRLQKEFRGGSLRHNCAEMPDLSPASGGNW
ncbi:unnamed protein product, partial [Prorocentrum cordatum]